MGHCTYCGSEAGKLTCEHIISRAVCHILWGKPTRNRAESQQFPNGCVLDLEQKIKDVCAKCNSQLSIYDEAGKRFATIIRKIDDLRGAVLPLDNDIVGWLVKTHCNIIRTAKGNFPISKNIYDALINHQPLPQNLFLLLFAGCIATQSELQKLRGGTLPYALQRVTHDQDNQIILSHLRLKLVDTCFILPSNNKYKNVANRTDSFLTKVKFSCTVRISPTLIQQGSLSLSS